MALTDGTLNLMGVYLGTLATHASLHTASPGTTGTNASAAARQPITWSVDSDGDLTITGTLAFTGGTASGPVTHVGLWSASTGGTFRGSYALTGDSTFNASGAYNVTALSIDGTAS